MNRVNATCVAVLIATAHRANLLANRALPSVARQSCAPRRVVVVDDARNAAAAEQTRQLVRSWQPAGIVVDFLRNRRTRGAAGTWNSGLDHLLRTGGDPRGSTTYSMPPICLRPGVCVWPYILGHETDRLLKELVQVHRCYGPGLAPTRIVVGEARRDRRRLRRGVRRSADHRQRKPCRRARHREQDAGPGGLSDASCEAADSECHGRCLQVFIVVQCRRSLAVRLRAWWPPIRTSMSIRCVSSSCRQTIPVARNVREFPLPL